MIDGKDYNKSVYSGIDREIADLVEYINRVDGIETTDSCFGHNERPCLIWCRAKDIKTLNDFIKRFFYFDQLWNLCLTYSERDYFDEILFIIESKYTDYPTVNLMVKELTNRFAKILAWKRLYLRRANF